VKRAPRGKKQSLNTSLRGVLPKSGSATDVTKGVVARDAEGLTSCARYGSVYGTRFSKPTRVI